jgi:hypothetical protein
MRYYVQHDDDWAINVIYLFPLEALLCDTRDADGLARGQLVELHF